MIISHKHKFIYIKCRKTAGTSVEVSLSKLCGPKDIITPLTPVDDKARQDLGIRGPQNYLHSKSEMQPNSWWNYFKIAKRSKKFRNHISAEEVVELLPAEIWNSYFKFTVERNPFDKVVSYYFWRNGHEKYAKISDFILDGGLDSMKSYDLYTIDKQLAVDKIYRFEDFAFFEKDLTQKLNLDEPFRMVEYKAKSGHRKIRDYHEALDEKAVELIKIAFTREIELLGYEF